MTNNNTAAAAAAALQKEALRKRGLVSVTVAVKSSSIMSNNQREDDEAEKAQIFYKVYSPVVVQSTTILKDKLGSTTTPRDKLVFVMGFLGRADAWQFQVDFFLSTGKYDILVLDNRGTGESSVTTRKRYTTQMMAHDIHDVLCHLEWNESFHLVGSSMGGMIAQELALLSPKSVASLALLSTHSGNGFQSLPPLRMVYVMLKNMIPFGKTDLETKQHNSMTMLYGDYLREEKHREQYDTLHALGVSKTTQYGSAPFTTLVNHTLAVMSHQVKSDRFVKLKEIPEILILTGKCDYMVHPSNSVTMAQMLNIQAHVWDTYGHHLIWECPDKINHALNQHLEKARREKKKQ